MTMFISECFDCYIMFIDFLKAIMLYVLIIMFINFTFIDFGYNIYEWLFLMVMFIIDCFDGYNV